jgi:UDP-N-acetyl-D-glucosamine dehydrogenase
VVDALNDRGRSVNGANVGVLGVAFKANVGDPRNAPAAEVIAELVKRGASVTYHDPHVERFVDAAGVGYESQPLDDVIGSSDVVVALVRHAAIDWERVYAVSSLVVDAVNSSGGHSLRPRQVLLLGAGWK